MRYVSGTNTQRFCSAAVVDICFHIILETYSGIFVYFFWENSSSFCHWMRWIKAGYKDEKDEQYNDFGKFRLIENICHVWLCFKSKDASICKFNGNSNVVFTLGDMWL